MPRRPRVAPGGYPHHVLNHAAGTVKLFVRDKDFLAFENLLVEAHERHPIRILAWSLMSDHWQIVVWPQRSNQVTDFMRWLTHTHAMRWRTAHRSVGYGPLYRGRFKGFIVQEDSHLVTVCRYVERSALTAGRVKRAQDWRWSSLWARENGPDELRAILSDWPVPRPSDWISRVNQPVPAKERDALETSTRRGRPFGSEHWTATMVSKLHLEHTVRPEGRPSRGKAAARKK